MKDHFGATFHRDFFDFGQLAAERGEGIEDVTGKEIFSRAINKLAL
ncbi:MAG: hypothetical protein R3Y63_05480 [Eubacteriales bacterium]